MIRWYWKGFQNVPFFWISTFMSIMCMCRSHCMEVVLIVYFAADWHDNRFATDILTNSVAQPLLSVMTIFVSSYHHTHAINKRCMREDPFRPIFFCLVTSPMNLLRLWLCFYCATHAGISIKKMKMRRVDNSFCLAHNNKLFFCAWSSSFFL